MLIGDLFWWGCFFVVTCVSLSFRYFIYFIYYHLSSFSLCALLFSFLLLLIFCFFHHIFTLINFSPYISFVSSVLFLACFFLYFSLLLPKLSCFLFFHHYNRCSNSGAELLHSQEPSVLYLSFTIISISVFLFAYLCLVLCLSLILCLSLSRSLPRSLSLSSLFLPFASFYLFL